MLRRRLLRGGALLAAGAAMVVGSSQVRRKAGNAPPWLERGPALDSTHPPQAKVGGLAPTRRQPLALAAPLSCRHSHTQW